MLSKIMNNNKFSINEFDKKKIKVILFSFVIMHQTISQILLKNLGLSNLLESHIAYDIGIERILFGNL